MCFACEMYVPHPVCIVEWTVPMEKLAGIFKPGPPVLQNCISPLSQHVFHLHS